MVGWRSFAAVIMLAVLLGCETVSEQDAKTQSATLTPEQIAELTSRARTCSQLGIPSPFSLDGRPDVSHAVTQFSGAKTVTLRLVEIPTAYSAKKMGAPYLGPVVHATVNGKDAYVALDTGSSLSVIGYSLARQLDIPTIAGWGTFKVATLGGETEAYPALVPTLRFGGLELTNVFAAIVPDARVMQMVPALWRTEPVVIVGLSALRGLAYVSIDYPRGEITLGAEDAYVGEGKRAHRTVLPLHWDRNVPCTELTIDGRRFSTCPVDTGGDFGILLSRSVGESLGYWHPGQRKNGYGYSLSGGVPFVEFDMHTVSLGEAILFDSLGRVQLVGPEKANQDPFLGSVIVQRYRVTFDFWGNRLYLE